MSVVVSNIRERAVAAGIDLDRLPVHVAVIMDGNGRWAQSQGLHRLVGHQEGYRSLARVLSMASDLGIRHLTVYGFSAENWRRPGDEVAGLMTLIADAALAELDGLKQSNVRTRISGRLDEIPSPTREALRQLEVETAENTGIEFILAINYGGRAEIVDACRRAVREGWTPEDVTEEALSQLMYCPDTPDPDLMIRTAGEMRWSNFLIWQAAYAELYVTQTTWPEFGEAELFEAVKQFQNRTRKFGGLAE